MTGVGISPQVSSAHRGLRPQNKARDLILVWDTSLRSKERGARCCRLLGRTDSAGRISTSRDTRLRPEWLDSWLISAVPSEVRR